MNYKIDGVDIVTLGAFPCLSQERIALSGVFNLPKRKGTTEYNWGTEIEPYVDKEDIELEGRTLSLSVMMQSSSSNEHLERLKKFKESCVACKNLETEFGSFEVLQKEEISVTEYKKNLATVTVKFWQPKVELPDLILQPSSGGLFSIDGYNLYKDFGISLSNLKSGKNQGKRLEANTTSLYTQTKFRDSISLSMSGYMNGELRHLYEQVMQFYTLCMKPGLRSLLLPDKTVHQVYFKDGITAEVIHSKILRLDLKMRIV